MISTVKILAWENIRHFTRSPLESSQNIWVTSAEIPYWWRVTTQFLIVLLIGWRKFQPIRSTTKIWVVTRHQYGISALVTQMSFCEDPSGDLVKCWAFSQAIKISVPQSLFRHPPADQEARGLWVLDCGYSILVVHGWTWVSLVSGSCVHFHAHYKPYLSK